MAMKICCHCGTEFSEVFARTIIDENYGSGKYNWICSHRGELCPSCAGEELSLYEQKSNEANELMELNKKCWYCGKEYNTEDVKIYIDQHFGEGKYDWVCGNFGQLCDSCAFGKLIEKEDN